MVQSRHREHDFLAIRSHATPQSPSLSLCARRSGYTVCSHMAFCDPPRQAAWRHQQARTGFEVVFVRADRRGWHLDGDSAAVEDGKAWTVSYAIAISREWVTQSARVSGRTSSGQRERV